MSKEKTDDCGCLSKQLTNPDGSPIESMTEEAIDKAWNDALVNSQSQVTQLTEKNEDLERNMRTQKRELDIARLAIVAMCADKYLGI